MRAITITSILTILATHSMVANAESAAATGAWAGPYIGVFIGSSTGEEKDLRTNTVASDFTAPGDADLGDPQRGVCYNIKSGRVLPGLDPDAPDDEAECLQRNPNAVWLAFPDSPLLIPQDGSNFFGLEQLVESFTNNNDDGGRFLGGIKAGYNWQRNNYVYGIEADITSIRNKNIRSSSFAEADLTDEVENLPDGATDAAQTPGNISLSAKSKIGVDWFGTIRGRLGYAFNNDLLPFVTAGLAIGKVRNKLQYNLNDVNVRNGEDGYPYSDYSEAGSIGGSDTKTGWTVGAGVDYRVKDNILLNLTYLYVDLGGKERESYQYDNSSADVAASRAAFAESEIDPSFHVLRVGVNWQF